MTTLERLRSHLPELLRAAAGGRVYERGVEYDREGAVSSLRLQDGELTATVAGSSRYRVRLGVTDDQLWSGCTCPYDDGACKHAVAAGLAWARGVVATVSAAPTRLVERLEPLGAPRLAAILADLAAADAAVLARVLAETAGAGGDGALADLQDAFDEALDVDDGRDWHGQGDALATIDLVLDRAAVVLAARPRDQVAFCRYAFAAAEGAADRFADGLWDVFDRLVDRHAAAAKAARLAPDELATVVLEWELSGYADGVVAAHARALGRVGNAAVQAAARERWEGAAATSDDRVALERLLIAAAEAAGDVDAIVGVLTGFLDDPYRFTRIVTVLEEADRVPEALAWCARGLARFPSDVPLARSRVSLSARAGHHADAVRLARALFERTWATGDLDLLLAVAGDERVGECERALTRAGAVSKRPDLLVVLLVHLGRRDEAWAAADARALDGRALETLALATRDTHPARALLVLAALVPGTVRACSASSRYEPVLDLLRLLRGLYVDTGDVAGFTALVADVRAANARRPKLLGLLAAQRW
jgi:uncharacterized Zn finger protein